MANNPNPARITDALWRLWQGANNEIPGVRLGGIWARTYGYHADRNWLRSADSDNYSIQLPLDRKGPGDKGSGIDLTMSDYQMRKRTNYLQDSCLHPEDNRMYAVREFYGTLNSRDVYGLIQRGPGTPWKFGSSDKSHLWHVHLGFYRALCTEWKHLAPVLSVLSGETWEQWQAREGDDMAYSENELKSIVREAVFQHNIPSGHADNPEWWFETFVKNIEGDQDSIHSKVDAILKATAGDAAEDIIAEIRSQAEQTRTAVNAKLTELVELQRQHADGSLDAEEVVRRMGELLSRPATEEPS